MDTNLTTDLLAASYDELRDAAVYNKLQEKLNSLQKRVEAAKRVIEGITSGLPNNWRISVELESMSSLTPTKVYRRDEAGIWQQCGGVVAAGGYVEFFGDGGFLSSTQDLIITDSHSGFGVSARHGSRPKLINLADDPHKGTIGGSSDKRHRYALSMISEVAGGDTITYDCMWP